MQHRVHSIFSYIDNQEITEIILKNGSIPDKTFFYATGLTKGLHEGSIALLHRDGSLDLLTSPLEEELAGDAKEASLHTYHSSEERQHLLHQLITDTKTIGINAYGISHADYISLHRSFTLSTLLDVSSAISQARSIKDETEITLIKKACEIADKVAEELPTYITATMTEDDLASEINYHLQRYGAEQPAFETISSFGANSAMPHYTHADVSLQNGDFILCDFGANYRTYNSDTTRTMVYGHADAIQKEIYQIVKEAQELGMERVREGANGSEIHTAVKKHIDDTLYAGRFIHNTGHALGLDVHDLGPGISENSTQELKEGMVVTVEPGIYLQDLGGVRIEDDVLVTKNGCEKLTQSSRDLIEIPLR